MRKLFAALLLATAPIMAVPVIATLTTASTAATVTELGDLSALSAIASDTLAIARAGDLAAAQQRITDFETAWDQAAGTMQPFSPSKWRAVDVAADRAIEGLRAATPAQTEVEAALAGLIAALDNPGADLPVAVTPAFGAVGANAAVAFSVTNADGTPLPCEVALKAVRDAAATKTPTDPAKYDEAMSKGLERCNADDDTRADGFFANAFALLG